MMRGIRIQLDLEDRENLITEINEIAGEDLFDTDNSIQKKHRTKAAPFHLYVEDTGEGVRCFLSDAYVPRYTKVWHPQEVVAFVTQKLDIDGYGFCPSCSVYHEQLGDALDRIHKQGVTIASQQKLIDKLMAGGW